MKKILSLALAASMCASLMLTTTAVNAETTITDLVPLYNFDNLETGEITAEKLKELGIVTNGLDGNATMTIEDMSSDATYGKLKKVLKYEPTSADNGGTATTTSIEFPITNYSLNSNEKLIVEYVFHFDSNKLNDLTDCFESTKFGGVGQAQISLRAGGNGWLYNFYERVQGYWVAATLLNTKASAKDSGWYLVRQEMDANGLTYSVKDVATGKDISAINFYGKYGKGKVDGTAVTNLTFNNTNGIGQVWIDNIHVYTIPAFTFESSTIENNATGIFYNQKSMSATFSNDVADISSVTVSGLSADAYTVTKDGKNITVTFNEELEFETTYIVNFTGITDTLGQTMGDCRISFTTEDTPDIILKGMKYTKGIGDTFDASLSGVSAANGLGGISLEFKNAKDTAKNVSVIFAFYSTQGGKFESVKCVSSSVPANSTANISLGTDMSGMSGKFVKAFVWEGLDNLKPWFGSIGLEIQ